MYFALLLGEKRPGKSFAEYRDNKIEYRETIDTDRYRMQKNSSFSLTIADVEIADAGRYSCAVTVDGANFPSLYHLKVLGKCCHSKEQSIIPFILYFVLVVLYMDTS